MAPATFRSGRCVHVWCRDNEAASGFYTLLRGGRHLGPYPSRDCDDPRVDNAVTPTARRSVHRDHDIPAHRAQPAAAHTS